MRLGDLVSAIEGRIPLEWAEEWDNPGLAVGDPENSVLRVALALDVTEDTVRRAIAADCQLLFSHHPVIFRAMKNLIFKTPGPKAIGLAVKGDLALYSAHTNWDYSGEGVNFCLAGALGLTEIKPLSAPPAGGGAWGLGAVGNLRHGAPLFDCMKLVKERWRLSGCSAFGDESKPVERVAVGGGSCGEFWPEALAAGAGLFITADISYHQRNDLLAMGLSLIAADHGEMERVSLPALKTLIEEETGLETLILGEKPRKGLII